MKFPTMNELTDKQKECVNYPMDKDVLVRGIAGSGKSLVIVKRAVNLSHKIRQTGQTPHIVIYTFVNSLVQFMEEVIRNGGDDAQYIEVKTLDKDIVRLYRDMTNVPYLKGLYKRHLPQLEDAMSAASNINPNNRFLQESMRDFLENELQWMKQQGIETEEEYKNSPRKGRGKIRISQKDRLLIFDIYQKYYQALAKDGLYDIDVICGEILKRKNQIPDYMKYDFVLIDEAQDLPLDKMLIAKALTKISMTISADFAQKIYQTGFTWKEIGISIRGNASKQLKGTHRNTRPIAALANSLSRNNTELISAMEEGDYTPPDLPTREGPKPILRYEASLAQEEEDVRTLVETILRENPDATIAVLACDRDYMKKYSQWFSNIPYEIIGGKDECHITRRGLKIVTYHSSKGLEFDYVILPMVNDGLFPYTRNKKDVDDETKEDLMNKARNLLYVGITRARSVLYLFAENGADGLPSPLIDEMDKRYLDIRR